MAVSKFRSVEDMPDEPWRRPDDPELPTAIARTWAFAAATCRKRFPPGVYRFRTIEDMQRQREKWEEANFRAYWERQREAREGES